MARSVRSTTLAVAVGALALGAGIGVTSLASADPTSTPPSQPSTTTAPPAPDAGGPWGHRGHGNGPGEQRLRTSLAAKLGVSESKVGDALKSFRQANRPANPPTPGTPRPDRAAHDAALATSLAKSLGIDQAKVTKALSEIRAAADAQRAAALKTRLDAAVTAGTLTRAEADAVTKAVAKGVIRVGPR